MGEQEVELSEEALQRLSKMHQMLEKEMPEDVPPPELPPLSTLPKGQRIKLGRNRLN